MGQPWSNNSTDSDGPTAASPLIPDEEIINTNGLGYPVSLEELGLLTGPTTIKTIFGRARRCSDLRKREWIFMFFTLFCLAIVFTFTIWRLVIVDKAEADFTFAVLLMLNGVFCMYYLFFGVFFERPNEIFMLVISTVTALSYVHANYIISIKGPVKLVRLILVTVCSPFIVGLGSYLTYNYSDARKLVFRESGASREKQDLAVAKFNFYSFLKFDLQLSLSLAILVLKDGSEVQNNDKILLPLALIFSCTSFLTGYFGARRELKWMLVLYSVLWVLIPAYAVYLVVHSIKDIQKNHVNRVDMGIAVVTFICASLSLVIRLVNVFLCAIFCKKSWTRTDRDGE